jgi:hypothetical protein
LRGRIAIQAIIYTVPRKHGAAIRSRKGANR